MSEPIRLYQLRKTLGMTQIQMAEILGIGQTAYSMIETGKVNLTTKNRNILSEKIKANPLWLETGIGEKFLDARAPRQKLDSRGVPYYQKPINGSAIISLIDMATENPDYLIDFPPFNDCSLYRPISGESMSPRYKQGDIIACKRVINKEIILFGESYLSIIKHNGDFYETVKIIRKNQDDPNTLILQPLNPNFDDTIIPKDSIIDLYIVKGKIERNL